MLWPFPFHHGQPSVPMVVLVNIVHNPPCEWWLTGLGVGAGSSVVVVGNWGRFWAVPCHHGALVLVFVIPYPMSLQHVYDLKLRK